MQRALLDIHFMMLVEEFTHPNILDLGKIWVQNFLVR